MGSRAKVLLIIKELLLISFLCKLNSKLCAHIGSRQIFSQVMSLEPLCQSPVLPSNQINSIK